MEGTKGVLIVLNPEQRESFHRVPAAGGGRSSEIVLNSKHRRALKGIDGLRPVQEKRIFTSGFLARWMESTKRTLPVSSVMTSDEVRVPSPKKRTPFISVPSVTPVAAKMMCL